MTADDDRDDFDPEAREEREIGREMVDESTGLGSVMAHFYRGEMDRVTTWRQRLDETTKWAVTVIAAVLVYGFSGRGTAEVLLAGILVTLIFLGIESRRYQDYDVYRSRIRLLQENLFANALDPSEGIEQRAWRRELSEDLRNPTIKTPYFEALARRLRRVYFPLLLALLAAWLFRVTAFESDTPWTETAAVGLIPGPLVAVAVAALYLAVGWIAFRPRPRRAMEEFGRQDDPGEWRKEE